MTNNSTKNQRRSFNLLPTYFQTENNNKFLSSTLDQLYKVPSLTRINGYVGTKITPTYDPSKDIYLSDINTDDNSLREKYQLHPALIVRDVDDAVKKALAFDDLINQLSYHGSLTNDLDRLFSPDINSYNPHIDWDKFINFREYYWLTNGPDPITVTGIQKDTVSTYTITESENGSFFIFTPDGVTQNPLLTFYKDVTYVLNVNTTKKFYIKTTSQSTVSDALDEEYGITGNGTNNGQIIFTVSETLPGTLYYGSDDSSVVIGTILIRNINENSSLDVEQEILGKETYKTAPSKQFPQGFEFINGLKITFAGNVTPSSYLNKEFIIEGVGDKIKLIDFSLLQTPENFAVIFDDDFDITNFDEYPFDSFKNLPLTPEYVTINRSSRDQNSWSRYNRWFHKNVIELSATFNEKTVDYPQDLRAARPIVEFEADLQLYNFGNNALEPVNLIDTETTDAFTTIEGSTYYTVDGVDLTAGQRIIFNADLDPMIRGKIFEVSLVNINGTFKINLSEIIEPFFGHNIVVLEGNQSKGTEWWYNGSYWVESQKRTELNQAPLFDLFDENGNSYSDKTYYDSIFSGNKLFGYSVGTGTPDPILGFPLAYKNVGIEGSYLFENYFGTGSLSVLGENTVTEISTSKTFLKKTSGTGGQLINIWDKGEPYQLAVQQFDVISSGNKVEIVVFDNPALISDLTLKVFLNNKKLTENEDYTLQVEKTSLYVVFNTSIETKTNVLINCYTSQSPNDKGVYEMPINLTNNPLNDQISQFTLTELSDHVQTMVERDPDFVGAFPGVSNLKSLPKITKYGTRLITSQNPLSFAQMFITNVEHNLINSIRTTAADYYQFKLNLIKSITNSNGDLSPDEVIDQALSEVIKNRNSTFPYSRSDMLGYGNNYNLRSYTVTDSRNVTYPLISAFDINSLSERSVLVYLNDNILVYGKDYEFDTINSNVRIITPLIKGDILKIKDYVTTTGSYVPPTPTKLGLYPKYEPEIYLDNTYAYDEVYVIQGHDGSLTRAYTSKEDGLVGNFDFRDLALLEFERRIFNNIKANYNPDLLNIDKILPNVFRQTDYSYNEIIDLIQTDFIKWSSTFGLDFSDNTTFDVANHKTYNYRSIEDSLFNSVVPGYWRGIYKYYFGTDRPNTHPWEMLGFSIKPSWWDSEYGPSPYTAGNLNLWQDLEQGLIRQGPRAGVDTLYAKPGLSQIIPVDDSGNIIDIRNWASIGQNGNIESPDQNWIVGDHGPVETAWRRSSLWPFAIQIILALSKPAEYASKMFDPIRMMKDPTGQYRYGDERYFVDPTTVKLNEDVDDNGNIVLTSGYSVYVIEHGKKRSSAYLSSLKQDLESIDFNLMYKAGGFLSKDKLDIIVDSVNPNSASPGAILPNEDYTLHFNVSNPVKSLGISGIIVEKRNGTFSIKGYDKQEPYFIVNLPIHKNNDALVSVGGKSVPVLEWRENTFYQAGQYIKNGSTYYTVPNNLNSGSSFNPIDYIRLVNLPIIGGASVLLAKEFDSAETIIPYGTQFSTVQEVYDLILGYGKWLENQGFIFDDYTSELESIVDWRFTGKEFLYWTTQNWADGAVITLSPFANKIKLRYKDAVVDNVLNAFYDYSLMTANGQPFPSKNFSLNREETLFTLTTKNTAEGFYFARLNLIQKEHAIIINNTSMFGDIVYDIETGYQQRRVKLSGFITGEWNGDFLSPGFVYDNVLISDWRSYKDYKTSDIVKYSGKYYAAKQNIPGSLNFDFTKWSVLGSAPIAQLIPNFDYKINQFEDFYSLDIDNFDAGQQKMAQHLIGYTPRTYLTNIILDPISQYKFYQGFIKEKGTANAIEKLSKASINNLSGKINFNEEWAIRVGAFGNFTSYNEIEFPLRESDFVENNQIIKFVDATENLPNDAISYILPNDLSIKSFDYDSNAVFPVITSSTYEDNNLILPNAGYVRTDDVTATAYNKQSLLDIANNGNINEGNTVWLGFRQDGGWDVYRYTNQAAKVVSSEITEPAVTLTFNTDIFHNLSVGDVVSIFGLDNGTDGVYEIIQIPSLTSFSVQTTLASADPSTTSALLFKFISVRIDSFDNLFDLQESIKFVNGDLVWSDQGDGDAEWSKWKAFKKIYNYSTSTELSAAVNIDQQNYGYNIYTRDGSDRILVSAPTYYLPTVGYGRVFLFGLTGELTYYVTGLSVNNILYANTSTQFGYAMAYDDDYQTAVIGAPNVNILQFTKIDKNTGVSNFLGEIIDSNPTRYGSSIFLAKNTIPQNLNTQTVKTLTVAAPRQGFVYFYNFKVHSTSTLYLNQISLQPFTPTNTEDYALSGNKDGTRLVVGDPANVHSTGTGQVTIFNYNGSQYVSIQTIKIDGVNNFGKAVEMSEDGEHLFVSSHTVTDPKYGPGKVYVYRWNSNSYQLDHTLHNPLTDDTLNFGTKLKINSKKNLLLVTAQGIKENQINFNDGTIFDGNTTKIYDYIQNSGTVYTFERKNNKFVYATELFDEKNLNLYTYTLLDKQYTDLNINGTRYGQSISINGSNIFVGAPETVIVNSTSTTTLSLSKIGSVYRFSKIDSTKDCWSTYREQPDLIDTSKIKRSVTIDTVKDQIIDYIDILDPAKGRILGLADQEIRYKTAFDPAVYSLGTQSVNVDEKTSWIEDHVGELWWDLSTVKYVWYEQGDPEYRKNAWGKLFAGASIDVYEWVQSQYLPSQWSALADTSSGLAEGISGQPKHPDNSVISVKQFFNSSTGESTNIYFYWVKNKVTLPVAPNRKIPSNLVSALLFDPAAYGTKYLSILSSNSIAVTNLKNSLESDNVYLNISKDTIENNVNQHTEWIILSEGNSASQPTDMLNQKLIDSLVGKDRLGQNVPDLLLSDRQKYGIEIRPRQSMFVSRTDALRNAIEYVNSVMKEYVITDLVDFTNLNSKKEIPDAYSREYDLIVDSYDQLLEIPTAQIVRAELSCQINQDTGKISNVSIINSGTSYAALLPDALDINGNPTSWAGPLVTVLGDNTENVLINTSINSQGNVISVTIENSGENLSVAPELKVRPYTVIVRVDSNSNNRWAKYEFVGDKWIKVYTQDFDTTQYWNYINWTNKNYDSLKPLSATVDELYQLEELDLDTGDYVRVNNQGNGTYVILEKVVSNGDFDDQYNLLLSENGTIAFKDNLWNIVNNKFNYDYYFTFDQTLFDQTPEKELINILQSIKNDIFIGPLKVYWNLFFFKCVKYALTEQKFLDWAFKTSFINVQNMAGSLDQRPVYKFQNSDYYEDYIKEVKPYHTKIRNYQTNYDLLEPSNTFVTDFDSPSYYNKEENKFLSVDENDPLSDTYPWKSWVDNYGHIVDRIIVADQGSGYTQVPNVEIIPALGDTGSGAAAEALISLGKVVAINVTNPGQGYTLTPTVLITGGGSTTLNTARAYPVLSNKKVRSNLIKMKFDRTSSVRHINTSTANDMFFGDGETIRFPLRWAAENKKSNIEISINGQRVLATDYNIITYRKLSNGYHKLVSDLVFDTAPPLNSIVDIDYNKNIELYSAIERIEDYYQPTVGMPGLDPAQLMKGVEYPGASIQGLEFDYTTNWDIAPFGQFLFGDDSTSYTTATIIVSAATGTNTLIVNDLTNITIGLRANTVALNNATVNENKFASNVITVTGINTSTNSVTFNTVTTVAINANTVMLEFWNFNMTPGILDTILDGGDLENTLASGFNPEDVFVDGETFISPNVGHSTEELIKGEMHESLAMNVFTRAGSGSPLVTQNFEDINQTTATTNIKLVMLPPNTASIMVSFNNRMLRVGADYFINYEDKSITINTQTSTGLVGITVVGTGGFGFVTADYVTSYNTTTISAHVDNESSIFATLNGVTLSTSSYAISRGMLTVSGLNTGTYTLQTWSFNGNDRPISEVGEQVFIGDGFSTVYPLVSLPGVSWSPNSQAIVQIDRRIMVAPTTVYYAVDGNQTTFAVDPNNDYPSGAYNLSWLEVYVNGIQVRNGIDFLLNFTNNTITFTNGFLRNGDVMAITNHQFSDYYFDKFNKLLILKNSASPGQTIKVITFTNGDGSLIRTENFIARPSRRYPISRPLLNDDYLWVTIGRNPLVNSVDYYIDNDNQTVVIRDSYPFVEGEIVSIMSMTDITSDYALGYKMFTDLLDRTQFKRISKDRSAKLVQPLYTTSTEIVVDSALNLTIPNPSAKIPGVVFLAGERIEFLNIVDNKLTDLRRATLGTGARDYYPTGSILIDQGIPQNLPYGESVTKQTFTATNTTTYIINGVLLTTSTVNDQLMIYYGGVQLRKDSYYKQNIDISYDTPSYNLLGSVSTATVLPPTTVLGTAYLVTATNRVWIYTNSKTSSNINGYDYTGLDYIPEQFNITNVVSSGTNSTATLRLNISNITPGVRISVIQRLAQNNFYASAGTSLLDDNGIVAVFLKDQPAAIPDKYYYGKN